MTNLRNDLTIAVDGHSSCGKSTVAKAIAKHFNYIFVDSGAMYRAVTYYALQNMSEIFDKNRNISNASKLVEALKNINISFKHNQKTKINETYLNEQNIEKEIRTMQIADHVSSVSKIKEVRARLVELQQEMGSNKRIVMDGRDIGTVVFPNADLKIFMTANSDVRAMRRYKELQEKNIPATIEEIKKNIETRDYIDQNREESPLKKADDAITLDNSEMTKSEQLEWVINYIKNNFN